MKWFVFVLFMTTEPGAPNAYLFTTPNYNSQQEGAMHVFNLIFQFFFLLN